MTALALAVQHVMAATADLVRAVGNLVAVALHQPSWTLVKGEFMYIVKADNPDTGYAVTFTVVDSEGHPVDPSTATVEVLSDNPEAVAVTAGPTGPMTGTTHFGAPGLANVNCTVKAPDGTLLGSFGAQFTVTAGDPAAIAGGTITFSGLTEATPPTP